MKKFIYLSIVLFACGNAYAVQKYQGFVWPESVAEGPDGLIYVSEIGKRDVAGDGKISKIDQNGKIIPVATGLYDPKGIVFYKDHLYVTDRTIVLKIGLDGKKEVFATAGKFPRPPVFLNDIDVSDDGDFYITDTGDFKSSGAVFVVKPTGEVKLLFDNKTGYVKAPNGVLSLGNSELLLVDWGGDLLKADLKSGNLRKIAAGFPGGDGLGVAGDGVIYITSWTEGKLYVYRHNKVQVLSDQFEAAADIALSKDKTKILLPDMKAGVVYVIPVR